MLTLAVDRTGLSLAALTFADPASGLWVDAITRPGRRWSRTSASSPFTHGSVQTQATLETATLEAVLYVQAADAATLTTQRQAVEAAFFQWAYEVTVTEESSAETFSCDCADLAWNEYDPGMAAAHLARVVVSIPCYPLAVP